MAAEAPRAGNSFDETTMEQRNNVDSECTLRRPLRLFSFSLLLALTGTAYAVDVLTSRNDLARTGVNLQEHTLTPGNVNARRFGKLWTLYADGQIVAQPLYVSRLAVDTAGNPTTPLVKGTS